MKITGWTLHQTDLKCKRPFQIATGVQDRCHGLLLELRTDTGDTGWGEGVPLPYLTGETLRGCQAALTDVLLPALLGEPPHLERLRRKLDRLLVGHPAARCAVDLALHDLLARPLGIPVWKLLGGDGGPVRTNYSIGLCPPEEAAELARALVEQDWSIIKLKIGQDPETDLERTRAVRAAVGPEIKLRLDANEGWNFIQARHFLERAVPLGIELIEQPLVRSDFEGLKRLRALSSIPIAADESVRGADEARRLAEMQAVDIFNLKLMKCGGILVARDMVAIARAHGISLMIGGMVGEGSIAVGAACAVASTWNFEWADLDADLLLTGGYASEGAPHEPLGTRLPGSNAGWPLGELLPDRTTVVASC